MSSVEDLTSISLDSSRLQPNRLIHSMGSRENYSPHNNSGDMSEDDLPYPNYNKYIRNIFKSFRNKCVRMTVSICKSKQKITSSELKPHQIGYTTVLSTPRCRSGSMSERVSFPVQNNAEDILIESNQMEFDHNRSATRNQIPPPVPPRSVLSSSNSSHRPEYLEVSSAVDLGLDNEETRSKRRIQQELFTLSRFGWYWGAITRREAEEHLQDQPDGAFLVRDSSADNYLLTVSFRSSGRTLHTRIEHKLGSYTLFSQQRGYSSIAELVLTSMSLSRHGILCYSAPWSEIQPIYPVRLINPVVQVRTLQCLCRLAIRQHVDVDKVKKLPLPESLQNYVLSWN